MKKVVKLKVDETHEEQGEEHASEVGENTAVYGRDSTVDGYDTAEVGEYLRIFFMKPMVISFKRWIFICFKAFLFWKNFHLQTKNNSFAQHFL